MFKLSTITMLIWAAIAFILVYLVSSAEAATKCPEPSYEITFSTIENNKIPACVVDGFGGQKALIFSRPKDLESNVYTFGTIVTIDHRRYTVVAISFTRNVIIFGIVLNDNGRDI